MSLAEIKAKIESEAKSESQRIIDAAREEIVAIQKKTSDEIAKMCETNPSTIRSKLSRAKIKLKERLNI